MAEGNLPVETDNIKKKALTRLAIAGAITLAALAGLWWLDRSNQETPAIKPVTPAPIISAPVPIAAPPAPAAEAPTVEAPRAPEPAPMPTPPQIDAHARPTASPGHPPAQPSAPATTTRLPAKPILANAEPPAGRGYVVQLGVFTDPGNAQELVARLRKQGIRAYTETRVHVGPFRNRAEAETAQAELRRMGISGVVGATK